MKCRILYIVGQLGAGGLERQIYYLLQNMDRSIYRPQVVVWNFNEEDLYVEPIRELKIPIYSLSPARSRLTKLLSLRNLIRHLMPEVLHSYSFYTNFAAWWVTLGSNVIAVGSVRSDYTYDTTSCGALLGRLSARLPLAQIYNSFAGAEKARESRTLFVPEKIFVVRNGVDLDRFHNSPVATDGPARVLGIGSLVSVKRWDRLLKVAVTLSHQGLNFLIQIAGTGPLGDSLERQAKDLGLADRVIFLGQVKDISTLLLNSTFLAHTSDIEGCPNVIMEAMASGRAVVATDTGDVSSLVDDGETGFVVRRGDEAKLVERLATLITNRKLCQRMGESGRAKAEREFGLSRLVRETLNAYRASGWNELGCRRSVRIG
jgi:glycosyltransferase involved in cell wall biosynthesis